MRRFAVLLSFASLFACASARPREPFAQAFAADPAPAPPVALAVAPIEVSPSGFVEELAAFSKSERRIRALARPGVPMPQVQAGHWAGLIACVEGLLELSPAPDQAAVVAEGERVIQHELEHDGSTWGDFPPPLAEAILKSQADLGVRAQELVQLAQRVPVRHLRLAWPLTPVVITSLFGRRMHPILHRVRAHDGVDLAAAADQLVSAAGAGRVVWAGRDGGYGLMVEIRHRHGLVTRYAHLDELLVTRGARVEGGRCDRAGGRDRARHRDPPPLRGEAQRPADRSALRARGAAFAASAGAGQAALAGPALEPPARLDPMPIS